MIISDFRELKNFKSDFFNYTEFKFRFYNFLLKIERGDKKISFGLVDKIIKESDCIFKNLETIQSGIEQNKLTSKNFSVYDLIVNINFKLKLFFYKNYRLAEVKELFAKICNKHVKTSQTLNRFRSIVTKFQKSIAVASQIKDSLILDKNYWIEAMGMKLVIDGQIHEGHIYTGYLSQTIHKEKWEKGLDEEGIFYHKRYSFEEFLNKIVIPNLSEKERKEFKEKLPIVEYYSPLELKTLQIIFNQGALFTNGSYLNTWINQNENGSLSNELYSEFCKRHINTENNDQILRDSTCLYVWDYRQHLYLQVKNRGKSNHSSISNGNAILAGGSLKVKDGKIIELDTFSGHYKTTKVQLRNFLNFLRKSGVDINTIKVTYVDDYSIQPWKIAVIQPGLVSDWLDQSLTS